MKLQAAVVALSLALPLVAGAADEQPAVPTSQTAVEQALAQQPAAQPATEQAPQQQPTAQPATEQPAAEQPAAEQPAAEQPAAEQPAGRSSPSAGEPPARRKPHPSDPFEGWNRGVFRFNEALDNAVLKPVATGYRKAVPEPVRQAVGNFFGNFGDAWSAVNHFLQGKPSTGLQMTMRFATNTVLGFGGLLDIATEAGLDRQEEDLGQTLGRWGVPAGPYIVWPVLGPSALRETVAMPADRGWTSPSVLFHETPDRVGLMGLNVVDTRARLLDASRMLEDVALDKYSFVRDAWLARRRSLVWDGDPPETPADNEPAVQDQPVSLPPR